MAAVGLLVLLLGPIAWWATPAKHLKGKDKADARNATRQVLLAGVGGMVLLTGAAFTARTFYLTRRGQYTDRYGKAIAQLASDKLTERLGGIYALEHLMAESERDHPTVVEVLAAFIREQTREVAPDPEDLNELTGPPPATDVQAAFTVLGRRPYRLGESAFNLSGARLYEIKAHRLHLSGTNFSGAHLQGAVLNYADLPLANLHGARLNYASFVSADLYGATLTSAHLVEAKMPSARLHVADLKHAHLDNAILHDADLTAAWLNAAHLNGADLTDADLRGAILTNADLTDAVLKNTDLRGVDLSTVRGLTPAQLAASVTDEHTKLPELRRTLAAEAATAAEKDGTAVRVPRPVRPAETREEQP